MSRIIWDCKYPNPDCISRTKYYDYQIKGDIVLIKADGCEMEYSKTQLKKFFRLEVGTWDAVEKPVLKPIEKTVEATKE